MARGIGQQLLGRRLTLAETDTLWTGQWHSVSWDPQSGKQVFVKLEPHTVVGLDAVRHVVQRTGPGASERVGEPDAIPLESEHRCRQVCADSIGTLIEVCEPVQNPSVVGGVGVVIQCRDTVDGSHLPCRAEVEQFGVEDEEVVVRLGHNGSGAGRFQLVGDPLGIHGTAGIGETPPTEVPRHMRDKTGHGEIDQLRFDVGLREARRCGHTRQTHETDAAKGVEHQQVGAGPMGRVRHGHMLQR